MSLNAVPLRVIPSISPLLDFQNERMYSVQDGGTEISYYLFDSQNTPVTDAGLITVTANPPDEKTVVHPEIYKLVSFTVTFGGTGPGVSDPLLTLGETDGLRQYPINSCTTNEEIKINGTSFNTNLNEYLSAITKTSLYQMDQNSELSVTPSMSDYFQNYVDGVGSARNPLNNYAASEPWMQTRGSFPITVVFNNHTSAQVKVTVFEPLMLSPFYGSRTGFIDLKTLTYSANLANLKRVWCHGGTLPLFGAINTISTTIDSFRLSFRYVTPKLSWLARIPKILTYPYHEFLIQTQTDNIAAVLGGPTRTISLNAINLEAVPKRIVILVRQQDADTLNSPFGFTQTDTFATITNINVNYANAQGKLSSATQQDLFEISRRNGSTQSWVEYSSQVGGPVIIDLSVDIGMNELEAPGLLSNPLLQITVTYSALNSIPQIYTAFLFIIYEGSCTINHGSVTKNIAVLNNRDVLRSVEMQHPILVQHEPTNMYGGASFFSSLKDALGKAHKYIKEKKVLSRVAKMLPGKYSAAAPLVEALGYGIRAGDGIRAGAIVNRSPYYNELNSRSHPVGLTAQGGRKRKAGRPKKKKGMGRMGMMPRSRLRRRII